MARAVAAAVGIRNIRSTVRVRNIFPLHLQGEVAPRAGVHKQDTVKQCDGDLLL